jgi:hypothetical protein
VDFVDENDFLENIVRLFAEEFVKEFYLGSEGFQLANFEFIDNDPLRNNFKELCFLSNFDGERFIIPYLVVQQLKN